MHRADGIVPVSIRSGGRMWPVRERQQQVSGTRDVLEAQKQAGSPYLVGDSLTAADIYWAAMSQMLEPMPEDLNPIAGPMREFYGGIGPVIEEAKHQILLDHRDFIFSEHLTLPLDFHDTRA